MLFRNDLPGNTSFVTLVRLFDALHLSHARSLMWAMRVVAPADQQTVDRLIANRSFFFFLNTGRSGSKWLAKLLGKSTNAVVAHEPVPGEASAYLETYREPGAADAYFRQFRKRFIYFLLNRRNERIYGETNGHLRRHIEAIKVHLSNPTLIHLVRQPVDAVTSAMNREVFLEAHPYQKPSVRCSIQLSDEEWRDMSRFQKICWVWREDNEFIRTRVTSFVRMEDILGNYGYFQAKVLTPTGLDLREADWAQSIHEKVNVGERGRFPEYGRWDKRDKADFERICGPEMHNYGY